VLIAAPKPDANLCKVLLSAAALGYPSPTVIDLTRFSEDKYPLPKVAGVHDFVDWLDKSHDDDLILFVDSYAWLQLRPQTLVDRFWDINRRADERVRAELGSAAEAVRVRQEIVFSSQKYCAPGTGQDPSCYAVPNSTLPKDIYGPLTDVEDNSEENKYARFRPKYLNADVSMGTVRAMRKLYAYLYTDKHVAELGDEQAVFSHVFGGQELWREVARLDVANVTTKASWLRKDRNRPVKSFNPRHMDDVRAQAAKQEDGTFEFGIGLDYGSELAQNTVYAEWDGDYVAMNNRTQLVESENIRGIPARKSNLKKLAEDVANSLPPFWTFSTEKVPRWTEWADVRLFTNAYTGMTPALVHHHAERSSKSALLTRWWPQLWFQSHIRTLFDATIYAPVVPVAVSGYDGQTQRQYWPYEIWKGGVRNGPEKEGSGQWITFQDSCDDFHESLFSDGKGPWVLPEAH
jgi:hypothetical protein